MPIPVQLNLLTFQLRGVPANLPDHEKERLLAETTISYGAGLFRLIAFVSRDRVFGEGSGIEPDAMTEEEFDDALNIVGNLGVAIVSERSGCRPKGTFRKEPLKREGQSKQKSSGRYGLSFFVCNRRGGGNRGGVAPPVALRWIGGCGKPGYAVGFGSDLNSFSIFFCLFFSISFCFSSLAVFQLANITIIFC